MAETGGQHPGRTAKFERWTARSATFAHYARGDAPSTRAATAPRPPASRDGEGGCHSGRTASLTRHFHLWDRATASGRARHAFKFPCLGHLEKAACALLAGNLPMHHPLQHQAGPHTDHLPVGVHGLARREIAAPLLTPGRIFFFFYPVHLGGSAKGPLLRLPVLLDTSPATRQPTPDLRDVVAPIHTPRLVAGTAGQATGSSSPRGARLKVESGTRSTQAPRVRDPTYSRGQARPGTSSSRTRGARRQPFVWESGDRKLHGRAPHLRSAGGPSPAAQEGPLVDRLAQVRVGDPAGAPEVTMGSAQHGHDQLLVTSAPAFARRAFGKAQPVSAGTEALNRGLRHPDGQGILRRTGVLLLSARSRRTPGSLHQDEVFGGPSPRWPPA